MLYSLIKSPIFILILSDIVSLLAVSLLCFPGSFVIIVTAEALVLLLIAVPLIIVAVRKRKKNKGNISH